MFYKYKKKGSLVPKEYFNPNEASQANLNTDKRIPK